MRSGGGFDKGKDLAEAEKLWGDDCREVEIAFPGFPGVEMRVTRVRIWRRP